MGHLLELLRHEAGSVAIVSALAAPVVVGGAALALDAATIAAQKSRLQAVADSAALAGAKELHLHHTDYKPLESAVRQRALTMLSEQRFGTGGSSVVAEVDAKAGTLTVTAEAEPETILLARLGQAGRVTATAVAHAFGSTRLCVLALDGEGPAIRAGRIASLDAAGCGVQSNSTASDGIKVDALSSVQAAAICTAGGVAGPESAFRPAAATDCPAVEDPLAGHTLPEAGPCDYRNTRILLPRTIRPGHYCGGLKLGPTALVNAEPGVYVISGGPLALGAAAALVGEGVSFRFVDAQSTFKFNLGSIVSLSAPTDGPMAGYLFFQDAGVQGRREFLIATDLATKLLGTIYLPSGVLKIDVVGLVAAQSAYTVVVADRIDIKGAHLVINSDYGATDVPVPRGVGPQAGNVALTE